MITAVEAQKLSENKYTERYKQLTEVSIPSQAKIGMTYIYSNGPLNPEHVTELQNIGYKIEWSEVNSSHRIQW